MERSSPGRNGSTRPASAARADEAIALLTRAAEAAPNLMRFWFNLGLALRKTDKVEESIPPLRKTVELAPNETDPLNILANSLRDVGQLEAACDACRRAIA